MLAPSSPIERCLLLLEIKTIGHPWMHGIARKLWRFYVHHLRPKNKRRIT